MNVEEIRWNQQIQTVWEMEVIFSKKTATPTHITIKEVTVGAGFFKTQPFTTSKGMGYMQKTRKEILKLLVGQIKKNENPIDDLIEIKKEIIRDYPELLC